MAFADVGAGGRPSPIGNIPGSTKPAAPTITQTTYGTPGALPKPDLPPTFAGYIPDNFNPPPAQPGQATYTPPDISGFNPPMGQQQPTYQLPDFNTLLQQQLEKLGFGQLDNNLRQQQMQLMIRYGDPGLAALAGFGNDPQSADFARQNYLSGNADLARLDKASKEAKQQIINRLAGHGLLFSGDTGYQLGQQDTNYGNQRYDLTNKYLDMLNTLQQNTLQQKNQMRQNLVNSLLNFYSQFAANPQQLSGVFG